MDVDSILDEVEAEQTSLGAYFRRNPDGYKEFLDLIRRGYERNLPFSNLYDAWRKRNPDAPRRTSRTKGWTDDQLERG